MDVTDRSHYRGRTMLYFRLVISNTFHIDTSFSFHIDVKTHHIREDKQYYICQKFNILTILLSF